MIKNVAQLSHLTYYNILLIIKLSLGIIKIAGHDIALGDESHSDSTDKALLQIILY
jgi:hypothetical protein